MSVMKPEDDRPIYSEYASDDSMCELVEMFVSENDDRVQKLRDALDAGNFEILKRTAHQIKGAAGGYGFHDLTEPSRALETSAGMTSVQPELVREDAERLISCLTRITSEPDPNME